MLRCAVGEARTQNRCVMRRSCAVAGVPVFCSSLLQPVLPSERKEAMSRKG
jgi:hypothetical protein